MIGISYDDFWHMNPRKMRPFAEAFKRKEEHQLEVSNVVAFIQGQYVLEALLATVGNMFSKKGTKAFEYPKKPYELTDNKELNEDELQRQREQFMAQLQLMQTNFELSHQSN